MKNLTDNAKAFLAKNPTLIGEVSGVEYYDHPELGDESPLIAILPDGRKVRSPFWELPCSEESEEWIEA